MKARDPVEDLSSLEWKTYGTKHFPLTLCKRVCVGVVEEEVGRSSEEPGEEV